MRKIYNFGSLNLDHVYHVGEFVRPSETIAVDTYSRFCGGKGLNQSIALARAGAPVVHIGRIGQDGACLKEMLLLSGVGDELVEVVDEPSGHAIIQVNCRGENYILVHGGANRSFDARDVKAALRHVKKDDLLLVQNETNVVEEILDEAIAAGIETAYNPAPMSPFVRNLPLDKLRYLILNETEAAGLAGIEAKGGAAPDVNLVIDELERKYPRPVLVLTLGERGAIVSENGVRIQQPAVKVEPVDTTAAGDTFIGFFLASVFAGRPLDASLEIAQEAAAISVTRPGAAPSIPTRSEVERS